MAIGKWLRLRVNSDKQVRESSIVLVSVLRASAYFTLQLQNSNSSCSKGGCWGGGSAIAFLRQRACAGLRRGRLACQRPRSQSGRASPALTLDWGWPALADAQHPEGTRPTIWDRTHKPSETVGSLPVPSLNLCWWCTVHAVCSTFPPIFRRLCELRELFGVDKIRRKKVKALLDRKMVKYDYQASSFHNDRAWGGFLDLVAGGQSYFSTVK